MSPELFLQLHKRGLVAPPHIGAQHPAEPDSRCSVQRIRPACPAFRSNAAAQQPGPVRASVWRRLKAWLGALAMTVTEDGK